MPGQILGDRYEVEQQLGKKSGRWTLLARHLTTQTPVILKLVFMDDALQPDDLKLFKREVAILQTLSHPATPQYLEYFEIELPLDGKALALVQSYVEGKSLDAYLKEGRTLSEAETQQVAIAALEILEYLHDHDPPVVHRDIKPSNLLLSADGDRIAAHVALVDFGSVTSFTPSEGTTFTLVGTDGYRPPEQTGRRAVRASDLYSLGATLITALTGMDAAELPRRGMKIDLPQILPADAPFTLWLKQMVAPDLDKRFKSAREAIQALEPIIPR